MNVAQLREFIELSKRLNFTATARAMNLTQPALSNHVKALEKETGATLVQRCSFGSTGVRLTAEGQRFLEMAKTMVTEYDTALKDLRQMRYSAEGAIRIRMPRHEYASPLLGYVREFCELYPNIETVLMPWCASDGYRDVASGAVDCAYAGGRTEAEGGGGVELVTYASLEMVVWVDERDPLAQKRELAIDDLDGRRMAIPANQKNESWVANIQGIEGRFGVTLELDEKYCDSLEDFLLNKIGPGDIVLADESMLGMPGVDLHMERQVRHFSPKLVVPSSVALTSRVHNPAAGLLGDFLHEKRAGETGAQAQKR